MLAKFSILWRYKRRLSTDAPPGTQGPRSSSYGCSATITVEVQNKGRYTGLTTCKTYWNSSIGRHVILKNPRPIQQVVVIRNCTPQSSTNYVSSTRHLIHWTRVFDMRLHNGRLSLFSAGLLWIVCILCFNSFRNTRESEYDRQYRRYKVSLDGNAWLMWPEIQKVVRKALSLFTWPPLQRRPFPWIV